MEYFKRKWEELRGGEFNSWGTSIFYLETDNNGLPLRQIEVYENGNRLKYNSEKKFDDYGRLGNQEIDLSDFGNFKIKKEEFQIEWKKSNMKQEHQKIINLISEYLTNHYDVRFGQALFNLRINEFANRNEPEKENYRVRDIHNDADDEIIERIKSQFEWFKEQRKRR